MNWKVFPAVLVASVLLAASVSASPIFDPTRRNCAARNCNAVQFGGSVAGFGASALPWVIQVYAAADECLRIEVTSQEADLEMQVTSPDASKRWRNDDSTLTPCPLCPLIAINNTPRDGWYTVHIGEFGGASVEANFTLAYGRYRRDNPNCTSFIPPADAESASAVDKNSVSPAPDPRFAPGH